MTHSTCHIQPSFLLKGEGTLFDLIVIFGFLNVVKTDESRGHDANVDRDERINIIRDHSANRHALISSGIIPPIVTH